jgi:predicted ATPase
VRLGQPQTPGDAAATSSFAVLVTRGQPRDQEKTALVGRSRELGELTELWKLATSGEGSLVTILGEAGIGKSRLAAELQEAVSRERARTLFAKCLSYRQAESYWLVAELIRNAAGVLDGDSGYDVSAKLASFLSGIGNDTGSSTYAESLDVLSEALGGEPTESAVSSAGPEVRNQALVRAVRRSFRGLSSKGPTLLILEDLQWIDQASDSILDDILSDIPGLPVLVVVTHRPGWNAPWSDRSWSERISLRTLRPTEGRDLARTWIGGELSHELSEYILARSRGNPFTSANS